MSSGSSATARSIQDNLLKIKGNRRVVFKNAIDPTTWSAEESLRNVSVTLDPNGNVEVTPVFLINPAQNPIQAQGAIAILDAAGNKIGSVIPTVEPNTFSAASGQNALEVISYEGLWSQGLSKFTLREQPDGIVAARATGAASATLLAAGGASKKYKIYAISIDVSGTAATGQVSVNEITSGTVILASDIGAAGTAGNSITCNPGVLQPTANNGIQVTSVANATVNASIVYGAAR